MSSGLISRKLIAFDFDHTIVDDNTDIVVRDMLDKEKISDDVKKLYKNSGWIPYMQEIFHILHENNFTRSEIKACIEKIPEVAGSKDLLKRLHETGTIDTIIISDSNSEFIKYWCDYNNVSKYIKEIFTNPANFNAHDVLKIQPYHHQLDCKLSSENLCKGDVLEDFVRKQKLNHNIIYENIFYVGDGTNDICPVLRLGAKDYGFARKGYRMQREIDNFVSDKQYSLNANIVIWKDGYELKESIFKHI